MNELTQEGIQLNIPLVRKGTISGQEELLKIKQCLKNHFEVFNEQKKTVLLKQPSPDLPCRIFNVFPYFLPNRPKK